MPVRSKAQNAAMHAAAEGKSTLNIPKSVGEEFIADQAPGSVKRLPDLVKKPARMPGKMAMGRKPFGSWSP